MALPDRRQLYRLSYPVCERPQMMVGGRCYEVIDISERSAKLRFGEGLPANVEEPVNGVIRFSDGSDVSVEGAAFRRAQNTLVIILSKGISFRRMVLEQLHLRQKYPRLFRRLAANDPLPAT